MNDLPAPPSPRPAERDQPVSRSEARNVVGVKYTPTGRTITLDSGTLVFRRGEAVVVDDRRGGTVATVSVPTTTGKGTGTLGRILRRADPRDLARAQEEQRREADALGFARARARALRLPIKVFRVDVDHGGDRALICFSSEKRVDFRDLIRDLSARLHARIEMRQVGVRDEAKLVGGIGSCGRELCCSTFLPHFAPVSIKMAKNQRLVLNPTKVAGQCGRLKCCLMYEDAQYVEAGKCLPKVGKQVQTPDGIGRVDDLDILSRKVRVSFMDRPPATFDASEIRLLDAKATTTPAAGPGPDERAPAEEDLEDLQDATKNTKSPTPQPAAENAEGSGEDTEPESTDR
jgi:cell fate regulator YaaT (PSP1 superfamily)